MLYNFVHEAVPGDEALPKLQYAPLDEARGQIRLATLEPNLAVLGGDNNVPILTIEHYSQDEQDESQAWPGYCALSYVCGDPHVTKPVIVNGCVTRVTEKLRTFLEQAATDLARWKGGGEDESGLFSEYWVTARGEKRAIYWIDALCINQLDNVEKSHQIAHMGQIYSKADRVTVWLGPQNDDSDVVLRFLALLAEFVKSTRRRSNVIDTWRQASDDEDESQQDPQSHEALFYDALKRANIRRDQEAFARRVDRQSHMEELSLCSEGIIERNCRRIVYNTAYELAAQCVCSAFQTRHGIKAADETATNRCLEQAVRALSERSYWGRAWVIRELAMANSDRTVFLCGRCALNREDFDLGCQVMRPRDSRLCDAVNRSKVYIAEKLDLADTLIETCFRGELRAALPHDYIYSLLPLASDRRSCAITPDYNLSAADLYIAVAEYLLQRKGLSLLQYCRLDRSQISDITLPSWVPNWTSVATGPISQLWTKRPTALGSGDSIRFHCGGNSTHVAQTSRSTLTTEGFAIATISSVCLEVGCPICEIVPSCGHAGSGPEDFYRALLCSVLADQLLIPETDLLHADLEFKSTPLFSDLLSTVMTGNHGSGVCCHRIRPSRLLCRTSAPDFCKRFGPYCHERFWALADAGYLLYRTDTWHLGLGPKCMEVGDVVFAIKGLDVPCILRRNTEGGWLFVSSTYLHYAMDGEVISNQARWEEVTIV